VLQRIFFIHCPYHKPGGKDNEMSNEDKKSTKIFNYYGTDVEVSEEVFDFLRRDAWKNDMRRRRSNRCLVSSENGTLVRCEKSCFNCPRLRTGTVFSFEKTMEEGVDIKDPMNVEELITEEETQEEVRSDYFALDEVDQIILRLRYEGLSDRRIAESLNMKQTTVSYRKRKAIRKLFDQHKKDL
jgi:RNA polymerase sigma factor (sigma-70 family)